MAVICDILVSMEDRYIIDRITDKLNTSFLGRHIIYLKEVRFNSRLYKILKQY